MKRKRYNILLTDDEKGKVDEAADLDHRGFSDYARNATINQATQDVEAYEKRSQMRQKSIKKG